VPGCAASLLFIEVSPDHSYCRVCAATLHFEPHAAALPIKIMILIMHQPTRPITLSQERELRS
jgi:hypothetical protein